MLSLDAIYNNIYIFFYLLNFAFDNANWETIAFAVIHLVMNIWNLFNFHDCYFDLFYQWKYSFLAFILEASVSEDEYLLHI